MPRLKSSWTPHMLRSVHALRVYGNPKLRFPPSEGRERGGGEVWSGGWIISSFPGDYFPLHSGASPYLASPLEIIWQLCAAALSVFLHLYENYVSRYGGGEITFVSTWHSTSIFKTTYDGYQVFTNSFLPFPKDRGVRNNFKYLENFLRNFRSFPSCSFLRLGPTNERP